MIVLDSYGLIAMLGGERAEAKVRELIERGERCLMPAIVFAEVIDALLRVEGISRDEAESTLGPLLERAIEIVDVTERTAWLAADFRRTHYRRRVSALSLPDCCLLAIAGDGESLATGDKPLIAAAKAEGIDVVELP